MITLRAPAKINLYLYVLGKRPDGYHDVVTRMQKIDLCDVLSLALTRDGDIRLSCDDPTVPADETNLAVRAARLLLSEAGLAGRQGVSITLAKNIPVAAGLGGGSSDAGSVLSGLNQLLGFPLDREKLVELGARLGADVPFFAQPDSAGVGTGRGDILAPAAALTDYRYLVVNPGFTVSTKWVFENYALTSPQKNSRLRGSQIGNRHGFSPEDTYNDLEQVTVSRFPVLDEIKRALLDAGAAAALMSGSGPTLFGLFHDTAVAHSSLEVVRRSLAERYGRAWLVRAYTGA